MLNAATSNELTRFSVAALKVVTCIYGPQANVMLVVCRNAVVIVDCGFSACVIASTHVLPPVETIAGDTISCAVVASARHSLLAVGTTVGRVLLFDVAARAWTGDVINAHVAEASNFVDHLS